MGLHIFMTIIPPQLTLFPPFISSLISPSPQKTMYDPKTQLSYRHDPNNIHGNPAKNYENSYRNFHGDDQEVVQFRPHNQESMESDDSGVCSPPLWKNTSPTPPRSPSYPLLGPQVFRSLSPNSRAQAIIRGQRELMEMVKNMPESSYELSLKDLVEHPKTESQSVPDERLPSVLQQRGVMRVKRQESRKNEKNMMRNGSFETKGLFLNMFFPFSLKSKKKINNFGSNNSGKVSPKPDGVKGGGERDWWKKKFTGSSDSDSSKTSINSGNSGSTGSGGGGRRTKNGLLRGCWPFFESRSSKSI